MTKSYELNEREIIKVNIDGYRKTRVEIIFNDYEDYYSINTIDDGYYDHYENEW